LGSWRGDTTRTDGTRQQWLMHRAADGTYLVQFRLTRPNGTAEEWAEVGIWGVRLPIYFTAARGVMERGKVEPADVSNPSLYDAYEVKELTNDSFTYYSYTSGDRFTVKKVPPDSKFDGVAVPQGSPGQVFPVFIGVWVVLGLFSAGFFFLGKNAKLKRKVWPPFVVATAVLFVGFTWATDLPADALFIVVPVVALITILNLRAVQFCNSCGATVMSQNFFSKPAFCSKCGAGLKQ